MITHLQNSTASSGTGGGDADTVTESSDAEVERDNVREDRQLASLSSIQTEIELLNVRFEETFKTNIRRGDIEC